MGGQGADTYRFSGTWGSDLIVDSNGDGVIEIAGRPALSGGDTKKPDADAESWKSDDGKLTYTTVDIAAAPGTPARQDLLITVDDNANRGTITIRNWTNGQLGINLGNTVAAPVTTNPLSGDFIKTTTGSDPLSYLINGGQYVSAGVQGGAQDLINGSSAADSLSGGGGNDGLAGGSDDDVIDGGSGDDVLLGGVGADTLRGGAGNDFIFGSAYAGVIDRPTRRDFTPPSALGPELARGFSWVAYEPTVR